MKLNKFLNKFYQGFGLLCAVLAFSSCEAGLTYEEADESQYTQVGLSAVTIQARELFENKMYAINWGNKVVENYIKTVTIGGTADMMYKNTSGSVVTLNDGTQVQPDETVTVKSTRTEESCSEAPGGKLYVINIYAVDRATYSTPNKGYLFAADLFGNTTYELVDPTDNRSEKVILPIRKDELVAYVNMSTGNYDCMVEPVGDAPALGTPGNYGIAQRYMVKNIAHRPAGVPQSMAMYEIRITFLPGIVG